MNSEYYQKKRKLEKQGVHIKDDFSSYYGDNKRLYNNDYVEWNFSLSDTGFLKGVIGGLSIFAIILLITALVLSNQDAKEKLQQAEICKENNGDFIVIDRKSGYKGAKIDIYGCVTKNK